MSRDRLASDGTLEPRDPAQENVIRGDFERDWDRILFSKAFRRLHDKTQVFPLPEDDLVHSRLTHSLEVASVGRSLGRIIGQHVIQAYDVDGLGANLDMHAFGDVVAAACLAHDIGNPPLGHAGEDAIGAFFRSPAGASLLAGFTPRQTADLQSFEGNAQGFRVLVRLQQEDDKGLQLTAATLASFLKYPRAAGNDLKEEHNDTRKKQGFCQSERVPMVALAERVGLIELEKGDVWARHPLAFLVEAADDICYSILDIEDGVRLGHVKEDDAVDLLRPIAEKFVRYDKRQVPASGKRAVLYLRSLAIPQMINECGSEFVIHEAEIMKGEYKRSLTKSMSSCKSLKGLKDCAEEKCYRSHGVLELELAGYEALGGLLQCFVPAVVRDDSGNNRIRGTRSLLESRGVKLDEITYYERIMRVVDFVSGMTDRYALAMYRRIKGISIPGRIA